MTERLLDAVASLRYKQIEFLIGSGVDINTRNERGQTALMIACFLSNDDKRYRMFRFLLKHKADILDLDDNDTTVFQYACMRGCLDIVELILNRASVAAVNLAGTDKDGRTALFYAVTNGSIEIVTLLVRLMRERGISVDAADVSGRTPLLQATMLGFAEIALILEVEGRANPRICDKEMHMDANGWAEDSARKLQNQAMLSQEKKRVHQLIFPNLSGISRITAMKKNRFDGENKKVFLPMLSYKDITLSKEELSDVQSEELIRIRRRRILQLNNKSMDSALSLLELSRKNSLQNIKSVSSVNTTKYSNMNTINKLLGFCSEQQTQSYREPARPPVQTKRSFKTIAQGNRYLTLATLAKCLPNESAQGIRFLTVRTNSRGRPRSGNISPSQEVGSENVMQGESKSPSPNAERGSLWKRLNKKSANDDIGDTEDGIDGHDNGERSLVNRLKKSKASNVPHIVTTHAQ